ERLASSAPERVRPVRGEAQAIHIKNPPLTVSLGTESVRLDGASLDAELSARVFDFGVASIRVRLPAPPGLRRPGVVAFGASVHGAASLAELIEARLHGLTGRLGDAVVRPRLAPVTEDYVVYRVDRLTDPAGRPMAPDVLPDADLHRLILAESRPIS